MSDKQAVVPSPLMILALFCVLLTLAVVGIVLGYFTGDSIYTFIGLSFLFILGTYLFSGSVEYETGANYTQLYAYTNGSLASTSTVIEYKTTAFTGSNARTFGILLSACGMLGSALLFWNYRKRFGED